LITSEFISNILQNWLEVDTNITILCTRYLVLSTLVTLLVLDKLGLLLTEKF